MIASTFSQLSYVARGKQRLKVLRIISKPMTATEVAKRANLSVTDAARVLRGFAANKLAKCMNPSDTMSRYYALTALGKRIRNELY